MRPGEDLGRYRLVLLVRHLQYLVDQAIRLLLLLLLEELAQPLLLILFLVRLDVLDRAHFRPFLLLRPMALRGLYLSHLFCNGRLFELLQDVAQVGVVDVGKGFATIDFHLVIDSWIIIYLCHTR